MNIHLLFFAGRVWHIDPQDNAVVKAIRFICKAFANKNIHNVIMIQTHPFPYCQSTHLLCNAPAYMYKAVGYELPSWLLCDTLTQHSPFNVTAVHFEAIAMHS